MIFDGGGTALEVFVRVMESVFCVLKDILISFSTLVIHVSTSFVSLCVRV